MQNPLLYGLSNKGFLFCSNASAVGENIQRRQATELLFSWEDQQRQKTNTKKLPHSCASVTILGLAGEC